MSELITTETFTDGQQNINAANMNGIIGMATVQPDIIANKPASATMDVADQFLVLKTDNTLARGRFDTIVNSTSSALPLADSVRNGMLKQVSGKTTDFVDGTNNCQPVSNIIPVGTVWDYLGATAPAGWLLAQGQAVDRTIYSALYALLGTTYGAGDGSTTFNLPDLRGRMTMAASATHALGTNGGAETKVIAIANLPSHTHPITDKSHSHTVPIGVQAIAAPGASGSMWNGSTATNSAFTGITGTLGAGGDTALDVLNPYFVSNKIVKV
jgi:microcystin-dependent protein